MLFLSFPQYDSAKKAAFVDAILEVLHCGYVTQKVRMTRIGYLESILTDLHI